VSLIERPLKLAVSLLAAARARDPFARMSSDNYRADGTHRQCSMIKSCVRRRSPLAESDHSSRRARFLPADVHERKDLPKRMTRLSRSWCSLIALRRRARNKLYTEIGVSCKIDATRPCQPVGEFRLCFVLIRVQIALNRRHLSEAKNYFQPEVNLIYVPRVARNSTLGSELL